MAQERIQNRPDECHKSCKSTVTRPKKAASSAQVSRFRRPEISASFVSVLVPAVNNDKANAPDRFASAPENVTIPDIRQISSKRWTIRPEASQSPQGPLRVRFQKGSPASRPPCGKLRVAARCRDHETLSYGADRFDQQACLVTASQPAPEPV